MASPGVETTGNRQRAGACTPEELVKMFRSQRNTAYLHDLFSRRVPPGPLQAFALGTLKESIRTFSEKESLVYSDPAIPQRNGDPPAAGIWAKLRRLNSNFYEYSMAFLQDYKSAISGRSDDGSLYSRDDDEQHHHQMFIADSLRPPGLEHLNGPGPLHSFSKGGSTPIQPGAEAPGYGIGGDPGVDPEDWAWDEGNPDRTYEQAIAEYWGGDHAASTLGADETAVGEAYKSRDGWRSDDGRTRYMRYTEIPIWQKAGRERNYDRDIEETLGPGGREHEGHVRGWDISRMYNNHGLRA